MSDEVNFGSRSNLHQKRGPTRLSIVLLGISTLCLLDLVGAFGGERDSHDVCEVEDGQGPVEFVSIQTKILLHALNSSIANIGSVSFISTRLADHAEITTSLTDR